METRTMKPTYEELQDRLEKSEAERDDYRKNWQINNTACQQEAESHARTRKELAGLREALTPYRDECLCCGGKGFTVHANRDGDPEQQQCQLCDPARQALASTPSPSAFVSREVADGLAEALNRFVVRCLPRTITNDNQGPTLTVCVTPDTDTWELGNKALAAFRDSTKEKV